MDEKLLKHGAISWVELMTSDVASAKKFYAELFNWQYETWNENPNMPYTVIKAGGEEVAGMMKNPPECNTAPPCWGAYVTVDNVDQSAKQIEALGGKIIVPPTDIPKVGRFCVFSDPQGALCSP